MGLFDKLRDAVNTATDVINKSIESTLNAKDPLADLTVKKYFEIICEKRRVFSSSGEEPTTGNLRAKKYIEHFIGEACDEGKLQKALELYNRSRDDYPSDPADKILSAFRKSLYEKSKKEKSKYYMDRFEAYKMFCPEEIKAAEIEYSKVLEVIKENVNYDHFIQGLKKIKYDETVRAIVVYNSFADNNPITRELILNFFMNSFTGLIKNDRDSRFYDIHGDLAKVVLKALHFEKHGQNQERYSTVTDDVYRDFVLNTHYYSQVIDDHPFDKDEYIEKFIKEIKESKELSRIGFSVIFREDYYCDLACNHMWKAIVQKRCWFKNGVDVSNSKNEQDVFDIFCNYFRNPDVFN